MQREVERFHPVPNDIRTHVVQSNEEIRTRPLYLLNIVQAQIVFRTSASKTTGASGCGIVSKYLSFVPLCVGSPHSSVATDLAGSTFHCLVVHSCSVFGCSVSSTLLGS